MPLGPHDLTSVFGRATNVVMISADDLPKNLASRRILQDLIALRLASISLTPLPSVR